MRDDDGTHDSPPDAAADAAVEGAVRPADVDAEPAGEAPAGSAGSEAEASKPPAIDVPALDPPDASPAPDARPQDAPAADDRLDFDLPDGEIAALSEALDDAFDETFGGLDDPEPSGPLEGPASLAAALRAASAEALGGTEQRLRDSATVLRASHSAMDADDRSAGHPPARIERRPAADSDARETAAARRAALLARRGNETVDFEDPDDDIATEPPSRPPDSLLGAIRWDDGGRGPLRIAFAGGRGGAGRTLLAANCALMLARLGRRCAVVDLDPVGAGLHTALGMPPLLPGPAALIGPPPPTTAEPVPGVPLHLLRPGRPMLGGPADPLRAECFAEAVDGARDRGDEMLLLDLGAQADPFTLDAWLEADVSVVVAEPLPAAIERAYGFIRAALWRRLLQTGRRGEHRPDGPAGVARELIAADPAIDSPQALVEALDRVDADAARAIRARIMTFTPRLLMNRTRNRIDREMGPAMVSALRRRWGVSADFLGAVDFDEAVREAARRRRPLLLAYPGAALSQAIEKIARRIDRLAEGRA